MPDVGEFGIRVTKDGVAEATTALDQLAASSDKAEAAAGAVTSAVTAQSSAIKNVFGSVSALTAGQLQLVNTWQELTAGGAASADMLTRFYQISGQSAAQLREWAAAAGLASQASKDLAIGVQASATAMDGAGNIGALGLGRIRMGLTSLAAQATGTIPVLDRIGFALLQFGSGASTLGIIGVIAGIAAVAEGVRLMAGSYLEANKAADEFLKTDDGMKAVHDEAVKLQGVFDNIHIPPISNEVKQLDDSMKGLLQTMERSAALNLDRVDVASGYSASKGLLGGPEMFAALQVNDMAAAFEKGTVSESAFEAKLTAIAKAFPDMQPQIAKILEEAAAWEADAAKAQAYQDAKQKALTDTYTSSLTTLVGTGQATPGESAALATIRDAMRSSLTGLQGIAGTETQQAQLARDLKTINDAFTSAGKGAESYAVSAAKVSEALMNEQMALEGGDSAMRSLAKSEESAMATAKGHPDLVAQVTAAYAAFRTELQQNEIQKQADEAATYAEQMSHAAAMIGVTGDTLKLADAAESLYTQHLKDEATLHGAAREAAEAKYQAEMAALLHLNDLQEAYNAKLALQKMVEDGLASSNAGLALMTSQNQGPNPWDLHGAVQAGADSIKAFAKGAKDGAPELEEILMKPFKNFIESSQSDVATFFEQMFTPGKNAAADFWVNFKNLAIKTFSELATADLFSQLLDPTKGGGGLAGSLAGFFGLHAAQQTGPGGLPLAPGSGIQASGTSALGYLGIGALSAGAGYALGSGTQSGLQGTLEGGAAGALIGTMIAPWLGTAIGGVVGALAGFVGSLNAASAAAKEIADAQKQFGVRLGDFITSNFGSALDKTIAGLQTSIASVEGAFFGQMPHVAQANAIKATGTYDATTGMTDLSTFIGMDKATLDKWAAANKISAQQAEAWQQQAAQMWGAYSDAVTKAKAAADAASAQTSASLSARYMAATGNYAGANAETFAAAQAKELNDAIAAGDTADQIAQLQQVLALEKQAHELQLLTAESDIQSQSTITILKDSGHTAEANALAAQLKMEQDVRAAEQAGYDAATIAAITAADAADAARTAWQDAVNTFTQGATDLSNYQQTFGITGPAALAQEATYYGFAGLTDAQIKAQYVSPLDGPLTDAQRETDRRITQFLSDESKLMGAVAGAVAPVTAATQQTFSQASVAGISNGQADTVISYLATDTVYLAQMVALLSKMAGVAPGALPSVGGTLGAAAIAAIDRGMGNQKSAVRLSAGTVRSKS